MLHRKQHVALRIESVIFYLELLVDTMHGVLPSHASPHAIVQALILSSSDLAMMQASRFLEYSSAHRAESVGVIVVTSTIALSYNLVHSLMIQCTSAVTTTVLGEIKIVGLMLASYLILGKPGAQHLRALVVQPALISTVVNACAAASPSPGHQLRLHPDLWHVMPVLELSRVCICASCAPGHVLCTDARAQG